MSIREQLLNAGISLHNFKGMIKDGAVMDADTGAATNITNANIGIPAEILTYISEKPIKILTAPRNATKLFNEVIQGDWTTERLKYRLAEEIGNVASYGDFSELGTSDLNNEWIPTDVYRFQTMIKYGDLEVARNAQAKIALVEGKQTSAVNTLAIYGNRYYMYGVNGLNIYGIVNHPLLPAALTPATVGGQTSWSAKGADAIYSDIVSIVSNLIDNSQSLIVATDKMKMAVSTGLLGYLNKTNTYGKSVYDLIKANYPAMEIIPVPEFAQEAGDYVAIYPEEVLGQPVGECVSPMKLRSFQLIPEASSFKQKYASATCGFRFYMPFAYSRMLVS